MAVLPGGGESARSRRPGERRVLAAGGLVEEPAVGIRINTAIRIVAGLRKVGKGPLTLAITEEDKARERVSRA